MVGAAIHQLFVLRADPPAIPDGFSPFCKHRDQLIPCFDDGGFLQRDRFWCSFGLPAPVASPRPVRQRLAEWSIR
jgi:hypothetical protein